MPDFVTPTLCNYINNQSVWYSRKDHLYNVKPKIDRRSLFSTPYENDVRVTPEGFSLLDKILSTESLFGKINIY